MAKHIVIGGPIEDGAVRYVAGDEIDLSKAATAQLLALGEVLSPADFKAREKAKAEEVKQASDTQE